MILVSACLLGDNCKYDGTNSDNQQLQAIFNEKELVKVCPEKLGGLKSPRPPAEIKGGSGEDVLRNEAQVVSKEGENLTEEFLAGARKTLEKAVDNDCKLAILKARSPSCGSKMIYDGSFSGTTKEGKGVSATLLERAGIRVFNEENLLDAKKAKEELN
ncbi:MAG: DUF523 domain-containing protein [Bacillota bacterium]